MTIGLSTLISCGGGGDSDPQVIDGLPADFDLFAQSGTWKTTFDIDSSIIQTFSSVTATIALDTSVTTVSAFKYNSDTDITGQSCDEFGPQQVDTSDFDDDLFDEDVAGLCSSSKTLFTTISDSNYQIDYFCDDVIVSSVGFEKISDSSVFNFGSLSFTSNNFTDLDTNSGVCGDRASMASNFEYSPQPNELELIDGSINQSTISVAAPYNGNYILIDFTFSGVVAAGVYSVVDDSSESEGVEVELASATFGGTATSPGYVDANAGTVTVTSVGASSAAGSFDITTFQGDTVVGNFSFNLQ